MKTLVNISWECSLDNCSYCWITGKHGVGKKQREPSLTTDEWIVALAKLPPGGTIDFCGGEPTHVPGFVKIVNTLDPGRAFALTTNLSHDLNVEVIRQITHPRFVCVSCSCHHTNDFNSFVRRFFLVRSAFPRATVTIVENPFVDYSDWVSALRGLGITVIVVPYQNPREANLPHAKGRITFCTGGSTHVVVNPDGNVYRCLTAVRSERMDEFFMGNLLRDEIMYDGNYDGCTLNCDPEERKCWGISAWTEAGKL